MMSTDTTFPTSDSDTSKDTYADKKRITNSESYFSYCLNKYDFESVSNYETNEFDSDSYIYRYFSSKFHNKAQVKSNYFNAIQKWFGHVTEIKEDSFKARLKDLTKKDGVDEEAEFGFEQILPEEREELKIGQAFYWSIGIYRTSGRIEKSSRIIFQRAINWDESLLDRVSDNISKYKDLFEDE
jgi:hypothetical protein